MGLQARCSDGDGAPGQAQGPGLGAPVLGADLGAGPHLPGPAPAPQLSYLQGPAAEGARRAVQDARWLQLGRDAEAGSV